MFLSSSEKNKSKGKFTLQIPLMVPESLSASPSTKWSPNCLKAVQHTSEDEKDDPQNNMVCIHGCWKLLHKYKDRTQNYNKYV